MDSLFSKNKRGQSGAPVGASGASFLVLLVTVIIVFYILFLPPSERQKLLADNDIPGTPNAVSGGYSHLLDTSPLVERVGTIDYVKDSSIEHPLNSFTIYTQTDAEIITEVQSMLVKNSAFERKTKEVPFTIDKYATQNMYLSFNVIRPSGELKIYLNSVQIFEGTLGEGSPTPILLPQDLIKNDNILYFTVSSPGFAFWRVNQYELQRVRVTGDVTNDAHSLNMQKIYLGAKEYSTLEVGTLLFRPDCTYDEVGQMTVLVNGEAAFYGTPDCGLKNKITMGTEILQEGENTIEFVSESGSYIIDEVTLETNLEDPEYPIYYFDLDEDLFILEQDNGEWCGKIDGKCPDNCEGYEDKDCCFSNSRRNYWCDIKTNNPRDRCVNMVLASYVGNCQSGYEDVSGKPHEDAEGLCGDDTDDYCPYGCSSDYDKDCCYETTGAYWCDDIPFTGQQSVCTTSVTPAECEACPNDYKDNDNDRPNCPIVTTVNYNLDPELKAGVNVVLEAFFVGEEYKRVDFVVNNHKVPVDTYSTRVKKVINLQIQEGTNSLVIEPRKDVTISQVKVTIE